MLPMPKRSLYTILSMQKKKKRFLRRNFSFSGPQKSKISHMRGCLMFTLNNYFIFLVFNSKNTLKCFACGACVMFGVIALCLHSQGGPKGQKIKNIDELTLNVSQNDKNSSGIVSDTF